MTWLHDIAALPVFVPLATAALVAMTSFAPRRVHEAMSLAAAGSTTALCALLLAHTQSGPIVYWLGGWHPHHGVALGISLTIDQLGAGMATLTCALVTAALLYSLRYFDDLTAHYYALMLAFMAGMAGFCLTGDLFNMLVFFELMGVAAYALTAYQIEERGPIQGAINFAVTNSIAGFAVFIGIGLLYGRTGALNLAQIATALDHHPTDSLVAVAFALLVLAFLTKAAAVPLHFWLADAHAVAPAPVCVLFSGVMVEMGVFGAARVLTTAFAAPILPGTTGLRAVLVGVGAVTTVVAAITCLEQRHIKRLLAFSTVSHVGAMICGLGLLTDRGLAGAVAYGLGHGLTKAALFMCAGVLLYRYASIDEFELKGKARGQPLLGLIFGLGGLLLAAVPLGTTFFGKSLLDDAAAARGYHWLPFVLVVGAALTGGAVLRVAARVFLDWGSVEHPRHGDERQERAQLEESAEEGADIGGHDRTPPLLVAVPAALVLAAAVVGLVPGLVPSVERAAAHFRDHTSYAASVLHGLAPHYPPTLTSHVKASAWAYSLASTLGALLVAWLGLFGSRLAERAPAALRAAPTAALRSLRAAHSGHIGDYVTWWTFGLAVIGGLFLWTLTA